MRSLPIIRDVPCSGKRPAGLRDLDQIRRTLPARPVDGTLQCFLQGEDGLNIQDEITNLGIYDDLGVCRPPDSGRVAPDSTQAPFPLPSHSPGATRRGQRRFFIQDPQTTFEDCAEIINIAIPPPPPPPPPAPPTAFTPTYSDCQGLITFSWEDLTGFDGLRVETGPTEFGPWSLYLLREGVPTSLQFSNYFDGSKFVRFSARSGSSYVPFLIDRPLPPVVAAPTFVSLSNVTDRSTTMPTLTVSPFDDSLVHVVSEAENSLIGPSGEGYVEVRRRVSYLRDPFNPPSLVSVASFSHPDPTAVILFTTDNTPPALLNGQLNNTDSAPYDEDFGHVIRAVAIVGGCTSPECILAVDKNVNVFGQTSIQLVSKGISSTCDLMREAEPQESAQSCNLLYGGTDGFFDFMMALACDFPPGFSVFDGGLGIWDQSSAQGPGIAVNGFTPWHVLISQSRFDHVEWPRPVDLDSYPPGLHSFVATDGNIQYGGDLATGPGGLMSGLINAMSLSLRARSPACPAPSDGRESMSSLKRYTSRLPSSP